MAAFQRSRGQKLTGLVGTWKINGVSRLPPFFYNPDLFWDADEAHAKVKIASGPNNPVGVVRIDLSKEHYGMLRRILIDGAVLGAILLALAIFPWELASVGRPAAPAPRPAESSRGIAPSDSPDVTLSDLDQLKRRALAMPVEGMDPRRVRDSFAEARSGHEHEALDILAPRGTRVLAIDDGIVAKLFSSARGGLTVYHFDPTRSFCYYYAHLDGYAPGLAEGTTLRKGDPVGYVGTTGNAPPSTPHLHFTIFKLGPEKRWWEGTAINPFPLWALPDALP